MKKKTTQKINRSEKAVEKNLIYEWSDRIVWPQTQNMNEFVFITSSLFAAIPSSMNGARESSHRRAPKSWLCWSHVAPQHLPCMLFNLFFCPFIGHFIQQKPFHSLIRRHLIRSVCCRTEECRIYCMNIEYVWVYAVTLFAFSELSWMGCGCILRYSEMEQFGSKWKYNNFMFLVLTLKTP